MAIEGSLEHFRLPEILQMISAQKMTGILTVQGENDIVAISFKVGNVVAADALDQTVEEGLGQVLASQGLVNPADFDRVSAEHEAGSERLLDLLVDHGYVDRLQLLDGLRLQTYQLMLQLLRWDQGEFKFYSGDEVAYEEGFKPISIEELLIRSVTDLGEEGQGQSLPNLDMAYEQDPDGAVIKLVGIDGEGPMEDADALWLSEEEQTLYDRFDGQRTARVIAEETALGDYKVLYTLYRLLGSGAVRPVQEQVPAPTPFKAAVEEAVPPLPTVTPIEEIVEYQVELEPEPEAVIVEMPEPIDLLDSTQEIETPEPPPRGPQKPPVSLAVIPRLVARLGAVLVAVATLVVLVEAPGSTLLAVPWLESTAVELERNQRTAIYRQIDRAGRTFFLLEGHYPDQLRELSDVGLLGGHSQWDPRGRPLAYSADDVSYVIQPVERGAPLAELATGETISGDFLLDPDFLELPDQSETTPLVLLD